MPTQFFRFSQNLQINRDMLAENVRGVSCVYAGPALDSPLFRNMFGISEVWAERKLINESLRLDNDHLIRFGSCELYANRQANYSIKDHNDKVIGFIRYTPEPEMHTQFWSTEGFWRGQPARSKEDNAILPILMEAEKIPLTGHEMSDIESLLRQAYRVGANSWFGGDNETG